MPGARIGRAQLAASAQGAITDSKRQLWMPAGAIDETVPRGYVNSVLNLASGTLRLNGGAVIRAGVPITSITFFAGGASITPTALWFCLVRESDNAVLAKTADDTTVVTAINTFKTLAITGGPYIPTADAAVWLGVVSVAATPIALSVCTLSSAVTITLTDPGPWAGNSNTGLTNPASLGATTTPPVAATGNGYGYYS